jgi:hypothetical protein
MKKGIWIQVDKKYPVKSEKGLKPGSGLSYSTPQLSVTQSSSVEFKIDCARKYKGCFPDQTRPLLQFTFLRNF